MNGNSGTMSVLSERVLQYKHPSIMDRKEYMDVIGSVYKRA